MGQIKRIPVSKLEEGMYISNQSEGVVGNSLKEKGFIRSESAIKKIRSKGVKEVLIDTSKGKDSPFGLPEKIEEIVLKPAVSLEEEREKAEKVYDDAIGIVGSLLKNVKLGKAIDVEPVEDLADDINNSLLNNSNALLCLSQIREKDAYLLEHSINVGILMGVFSRFLGYEKDTVHQLVVGALLHDIGKIRVPHHVLNKPGKFTEQEWIEMKMHVAYGQEVLLNSKGVSDVTLSICGQHHERLDGSGYPLGLDYSNINTYGRMAAVVDVYDAVTADRCYHDGMSPFRGMKLLLQQSGNHLDKDFVYQFIRCMSIYPVGTLVELSNGKLGIVVQSNAKKPDQPQVRIIFNLKHNHYEKVKLIDLSSPLIDLSIVGAIDPRAHDIKVAEFL